MRDPLVPCSLGAILLLSCLTQGLSALNQRSQLGAAEPSSASTAPSTAEPVRLERITLFPAQVTLAGRRSRQGFRVTGEYADGSRRDVTAACEFSSSDPTVVDVSAQGIATPRSNGAALISVKLQGLDASAKLSTARVEDAAYNFRHDVLPVIEKLTCNQMGCHGSPKGKKRLQLSLFSADPRRDYLQLADKEKKLVDAAEPAKSWMLLKAICEEDHGGGPLTEEGSPEYNLLLDWIKQGAPEGRADETSIERVEVFPAERRMLPGENLRLLVEAHYSDGSMRDVTDLAAFKSDEEAVAKSQANGVVQATGYGEAVIMISYGGRLTTSRIISSQPASIPYPEVPTHGRIDELVLSKLRSLNIVPSDLCSDGEFVRRVYLDVTGMLPTADQAREFLADVNPEKRRLLIDALLARPEYADFYAVKWGDVLQINRAEPARLDDKGMWAFYRWLWDALDQNKPMDRFVHEILTARGSGYRNGPVNFFRVGEGPQGMAEHASTAFLGVRLDCAHCHNHPFEQFTLTDNLGMAAFFTRVRLKRTAEQDEEIVYLTDSGSIKNPETNERAAAKFLGGVEIAEAERKGLKAAETLKASAERTAAEKASRAQAATAKQQTDKEAARKRLMELATRVKHATDQLAQLEQTADRVAAELAAAQQGAASQTEMERELAEKLVADKSSVLKSLEGPIRQAQAATDTARVAQRDFEDEMSVQTAANNAAVAAANAEKREADKRLRDAADAVRTADAAVAAVENGGDPRAKLAAWMTSPENPYFSRHFANRAWTWLLGRGIIDEPDDFRSTNPASNPALLDHLAGEFVKSGYDMKALFRLILNSRTYQLSARPNLWNKHDHIHYSHAMLKRLTAEQLATAISQATGVHEKYPGLPLGTRATQLPDVSMRSEFLDLFGRPKRATPVESERTCDTHIGQSLQMISSEYMAAKLRDNNGRVAKLAATKWPAEEIIDELYLTTLARLPTAAERQVVLAEPIDEKQRREKFEDLLWVLMNTKEFLFNH